MSRAIGERRSPTATSKETMWIRCEDQLLATGKILSRWLRSDTKNGMVSTTGNRFIAHWCVNPESVRRAYMERQVVNTLEEAQAIVEEATR